MKQNSKPCVFSLILLLDAMYHYVLPAMNIICNYIINNSETKYQTMCFLHVLKMPKFDENLDFWAVKLKKSKISANFVNLLLL